MVDRNVLKTFRAGDVIMRQGDPGDCAYIIEKGRVEIVLEKAGEDEDGGQLVGTRGAGSMIGEMAIIDGAPRSATVRALEDCEFLVITSKDFEKRLQSADPVVKMTAQVVLTRYRDTLMRANITGENSTWPPAELIEASLSEHVDAVERIKLANELRKAFDGGDLHLHYQPIIDLNTGLSVGFEDAYAVESSGKRPDFSGYLYSKRGRNRLDQRGQPMGAARSLCCP